MHPLVLLVAVGVGIYVGKKLTAAGTKVRKPGGVSTGSSSSKEKQKDEAATLKEDPVTGVYKVDD